MTHLEAGDRVAAEWLRSALPPDIEQSFDSKQRTALIAALRTMPWRTHAVDMRFDFPVFGRRFYFAVIGGYDQRGAARRKAELQSRPLRTKGNMLFVLGLAVLIYLVAVFGILLYSRVVEF
ncbi:MAG: hypothetical protein HQL37_11950 [Alphaproteobacteria bacterium]|nr:hypothetical protein [Alphaproteobacteria bacterium]